VKLEGRVSKVSTFIDALYGFCFAVSGVISVPVVFNYCDFVITIMSQSVTVRIIVTWYSVCKKEEFFESEPAWTHSNVCTPAMSRWRRQHRPSYVIRPILVLRLFRRREDGASVRFTVPISLFPSLSTGTVVCPFSTYLLVYIA
jgi:hypothetical protein